MLFSLDGKQIVVFFLQAIRQIIQLSVVAFSVLIVKLISFPFTVKWQSASYLSKDIYIFLYLHYHTLLFYLLKHFFIWNVLTREFRAVERNYDRVNLNWLGRKVWGSVNESNEIIDLVRYKTKSRLYTLLLSFWHWAIRPSTMVTYWLLTRSTSRHILASQIVADLCGERTPKAWFVHANVLLGQ